MSYHCMMAHIIKYLVQGFHVRFYMRYITGNRYHFAIRPQDKTINNSNKKRQHKDGLKRNTFPCRIEPQKTYSRQSFYRRGGDPFSLLEFSYALSCKCKGKIIKKCGCYSEKRAYGNPDASIFNQDK